ncbi:MAG: hypothetical protein ACFFBD_19500, partial [Candidatus Hodarchaeota archaeon]
MRSQGETSSYEELVLETVSPKDIQIFASVNALFLVALYLMKFLQLPITLKGSVAPEDKRGDTFTAEIFENREGFLRVRQNSVLSESPPLPVG